MTPKCPKCEFTSFTVLGCNIRGFKMVCCASCGTAIAVSEDYLPDIVNLMRRQNAVLNRLAAKAGVTADLET